MTVPSWLNEVVRNYGRHAALHTFELNERGVAGLRFENGVSLRFEYTQESLMISAGIQTDNNEDAMKKLLVAVHPDARLPIRVRAAYLSKSGEAIYVVRLPERSVTVSLLEQSVRLLFQMAEKFRRNVQ